MLSQLADKTPPCEGVRGGGPGITRHKVCERGVVPAESITWSANGGVVPALCSLFKDLSPNHFQHPIEVLIDFRIQDPDKPDPERLDELLTLLIVFRSARLKMAVPIEFDTQLDLD